jgi:antitoxin component YwqK of YwqJK toxin-antitoxin module
MIHTEYYKDGSPCECDEMHREYYEALISETPYVNGKKHGKAKGYYASGALKYVIPYINGKIHGIEKQYFESGVLKYEYLRATGGTWYRPKENFL